MYNLDKDLNKVFKSIKIVSKILLKNPTYNVRVRYTAGSYSYLLHIRDSKNEYVDCYSFPSRYLKRSSFAKHLNLRSIQKSLEDSLNNRDGFIHREVNIISMHEALE